MINEVPIPFSAPMVRALLAGTKTQTRRILKPQPQEDVGLWLAERPLRWQAGNQLWVRETISFARDQTHDTYWYAADSAPVQWGNRAQAAWLANYQRAKSPAIHMPRWASRLTLTVTDVRVQRLQDISEADALAEGVEEIDNHNGQPRYKVYGKGGEKLACPYGTRISYSTLWDSINGETSWDANPWVCAISFDCRKGNVDAV